MSVAVREYRMLIGGEWVDAASEETFETVNPFTGRPWALVPRAGAFDVDRAVTAARDAFPAWRADHAAGLRRAAPSCAARRRTWRG
jgi:(Z)-2-((N-methylformamido)methylene)-5-hydroxybutyrolactone dehydrogenase